MYKVKSTPRNLLWMTGILIKNGLIAIEIFETLSPRKSQVPQQYQKFKSSLKGVSRFKRKVMVGELAVEGRRDAKNVAAAVVDEIEEVEMIDELKINQKAGLIAILLGLGEVLVARKLLNDYPQFLEMFEDISFNLSRVLDYKLENVHFKSIPWIGFIHKKECIPSMSSLQPPARTLSTKDLESITLGRKLKHSKELTELTDWYSPESAFFYPDWKIDITQTDSAD